jgi:trimeric autotransporter adhesin
VQTNISYTLPNNVENLILTGSANLNGTGNVLVNFLTGNSGSNILTGGEGNDTLYTTVTYTLAAGSSIELLMLRGNAAIGATGNELNGTIYGNAKSNILNGQARNDWLHGKGGNDILTGGTGNDNFWFDSALNATTN